MIRTGYLKFNQNLQTKIIAMHLKELMAVFLLVCGVKQPGKNHTSFILNSTKDHHG